MWMGFKRKIIDSFSRARKAHRQVIVEVAGLVPVQHGLRREDPPDCAIRVQVLPFLLARTSPSYMQRKMLIVEVVGSEFPY